MNSFVMTQVKNSHNPSLEHLLTLKADYEHKERELLQNQ